MAIPKRTADRIRKQLRKYQSVVKAQHDRDVSEADTVTVVKDILDGVFGYDKYAELTGEHAIRGTYCDLAVQFDGKLQLLIEVKAIGIDLQERHVKQAIDYAANQGVEWVVLTNARNWILFHVLFKKPINKEEIVRIDILDAEPKREDELAHHRFVWAADGVNEGRMLSECAWNSSSARLCAFRPLGA